MNEERLRKSAKGQECHARIPLVCNFDPSTTVLAHIRRAGLGGMGQKPPMVCSLFACHNCHSLIDGRTKMPKGMRKSHLVEFILDGHLRTLSWWVRNGLL